MKIIANFVLVSLFCCMPAFSFTTDAANKTLTSNGSSSDVQAAVNAGADGWTVLIPSGSFTWTTGISVSGKGIKLQGAGSGRVVARSTSSVAIGTGSKTFTTQSGLSIANGQTLRIERTGSEVIGGNATGTRCYMIGTVTSYSGTSLVMDVTSVGGSGTHPVWIISTSAVTTITHSAGANVLISLTEDASNNVEVSGFRFVAGTGTDDYVQIRSNSGQPIMIHDCYFESTVNYDCIQCDANRGVIYNCSFVAFPFSRAQLAIHHVCDDITNSWTTASTMGTADLSGKSNLYIEDCDFHAWLNATDMDANSRSVVRHCLLNNTAFGTHGADTGNWGQRHFELYDNVFVYNGFNNGQTLPLTWWVFIRGGTGVITDNIMPDMSSQDYGNKLEINMTVMNLQRSAGPNPCWGAGQSGVQYPAPRQVGMGRVTGTAGADSITYKGDSEPIYIWNNAGAYSAGTSDYGGLSCATPDSSADYIVAGRDYFNNGTSKPGYVKYTYPHPSRGPSGPAAPGNLRVTSP